MSTENKDLEIGAVNTETTDENIDYVDPNEMPIEEHKKAINLPDLIYVKSYIKSLLNKAIASLDEKYYEKTDTVENAVNAENAKYATDAENAVNAENAKYAESTGNVEHADSADIANHATTADGVVKTVTGEYKSFTEEEYLGDGAILKLGDACISKRRLVWTGDNISVTITNPTGLIHIEPFEIPNKLSYHENSRWILCGRVQFISRDDGVTVTGDTRFETPPIVPNIVDGGSLLGEIVLPIKIGYTLDSTFKSGFKNVELSIHYWPKTVDGTTEISFSALIADDYGDCKFSNIEFIIGAIYEIIQ